MLASWYCLFARPGKEQKAKKKLEEKIEALDLKDQIREILIPVEKVISKRDGRKITHKGRLIPGYILIKMVMNPDNWHIVKETEGIINFLGKDYPKIFSFKEVHELKMRMREEKVKQIDFKVGDFIKIKSGLFANFDGIIQGINLNKERVKVSMLFQNKGMILNLDFGQIIKE